MKPFTERWISDYFVGVFPKEELDAMIDDSVQSSLDTLEEHGDDIDWEIIFLMKVMKKQLNLQEKVLECYDTVATF